MKKQILKSNILLLLTAIIWGFAFVAQRVGMKFLGPFTFNAVRFLLGSISLIPIIMFYKSKSEESTNNFKNAILPGIISGIFLFLGSSFQQVGLQGTTAGKAAFITGLYIVIVPILGVFLKKHIDINSWIGAVMAIIGLYLLCVTGGFNISYSDLLELVSAFMFSVQILLIDYFVNKVDSIKLAFYQFMTCTILSFIIAIFKESINFHSITLAAVPILYGGIMSVGVAYTLQIIGQKYAEPTHASIILSMESVFASIGGFLILGEYLGARGVFGCLLMLVGMLLSAVKPLKDKNSKVVF